MKRAGNLIQQIAAYDNLYIAFFKAAKSKRTKSEVINYEAQLDNNLKQLQAQIVAANIEVGNYHYFKIFDPKERLICAASFPERVLHHAIINVCHPYFEKQLIYYTYATRLSKGTYAALDKAKEYTKKFPFYAKLDVRKYFNNISHEVLQKLLAKIFKDKTLLVLFAKIIESYQVNSGFGIPIGNLTSQYFANYYLSSADHYTKEILKLPGYIRYMDDIVMYDVDKHTLNEKVFDFIEFVKTKLLLEFKPMILNTTKHGLSFLGYRLFPDEVKLNNISKQRFCKKIKKYYNLLNTGLWSQTTFARHVSPLISFTEYAKAKQLRNKMLIFEN